LVVLRPLGKEFHSGGKSKTNNMRITKNMFCRKRAFHSISFRTLMINDQHGNLQDWQVSWLLEEKNILAISPVRSPY
jgi:hypothetical protein